MAPGKSDGPESLGTGLRYKQDPETLTNQREPAHGSRHPLFQYGDCARITCRGNTPLECGAGKTHMQMCPTLNHCARRLDHRRTSAHQRARFGSQEHRSYAGFKKSLPLLGRLVITKHQISAIHDLPRAVEFLALQTCLIAHGNQPSRQMALQLNQVSVVGQLKALANSCDLAIADQDASVFNGPLRSMNNIRLKYKRAAINRSGTQHP